MKSLLIPPDKVLTVRKIEYLSLIALGCKNQLIAEYLVVSKSTVKKMLELIFKDLKAKDRANAVAIAFAHKIISVESITKVAEKYNLMN